MGVVRFFGHKLSLAAGAARELRAFADFKLNRVDKSTFGNVFQSKAVTHFNICGRAGHKHIAHLHAERMKDVSLLAVSVV